jgi:hypothetical protein
MLLFMKGAGVVSSVLVVIALAVALLKALIGLVAFVGFALKLLIILAFILVIGGVGFMALHSWQEHKRHSI